MNHILRIARDGAKECAIETRPLSVTNSTSSNTPDVSDASTPTSECGSQCGDNVSKPIAGRQPNLFFTADVAKSISEADIVLIAVNTPTKSRGAGAGAATDMTAFEAVTNVVAQHARPGAIIVEKSTVPCRTAQFVQDTVRQPK